MPLPLRSAVLGLIWVTSVHATADKEITVLLVNGRQTKELLDQSTFYLSAAVDPMSGEPLPIGAKIRKRVLSMVEFGKLSVKELDRCDCIFLCDVPRLTRDEARRLEGFVQGGGAAIFCLGPQVDVNAYNKELYRKGKGLLPVALLERKNVSDKKVYGFAFTETTFKQPPLVALSGDNGRESFRRVEIHEFVRVDTPSPKAKVANVLSFDEIPLDKKNKRMLAGIAMLEWRPFADAKHKGTGRVVLITTTVNREWNDWPLSPSFLPVIQELLRFVTTDRNRR